MEGSANQRVEPKVAGLPNFSSLARDLPYYGQHSVAFRGVGHANTMFRPYTWASPESKQILVAAICARRDSGDDLPGSLRPGMR